MSCATLTGISLRGAALWRPFGGCGQDAAREGIEPAARYFIERLEWINTTFLQTLICFWSNNADVSVPECLFIINMKIPHHRGSKTRSYIDTGPLPVTSTTYPAGARTHRKRVAFQALSARIIALIPHMIPQGVWSQNYKRFEIIIVTPHTAPHMGLEGALGGRSVATLGSH